MCSLDMKKAVVLAALLAVQSIHAQGAKYFPDLAFDENQQQNEQRDQWYTKALTAMREPSLLEESKSGIQVYRFLWLRSFHNPIAVRLNVNTDGTSLLTVKVTSGKGGYEPGELVKNTVRRLSKQETDWFLSTVQETGYWDMPSYPEPSNVIVLDGAQWIVEAVKDKKYKVVDRASPEKRPIRALGLAMLIDLAKLKLLYQDVY